MQHSPTSPKFVNTSATSHRYAPSGISTNSSPALDNTTLPPSSTEASASVQTMSFATHLKSWDDNQVSRWLQDHRCGSHASLFVAHDIRGDVLLELDNGTLKEMGIASVGDRVRILTAVKQLRSQLSRSKTSSLIPPSSTTTTTGAGDGGPGQKHSKRLESARPPPLHLSYNARSQIAISGTPSESSSTPGRTPQAGTSTLRQNLPPLPPPPRTHPPPPPPSIHPSTQTRPLGVPSQPYLLPGRRTPVQGESSTPSSSSAWMGEYGLPPRPSPGAITGKLGTTRSASPSQVGSFGPAKRSGTAGGLSSASSTSLRPPTHERAHSLPGANPLSNPHPYASQALQPNTQPANPLSPIEESILTPIAGTGSSQLPSSTDYRVGRGPFATPTNRLTPSHPTPTIEDIRRVTIKCNLPEEGISRVVNIADCIDGVKVMERILKKFNKLVTPRTDSEVDSLGIDDTAGLIVDGWGVFLPSNCDISDARPLTEVELLNICHAEPDHPLREQGLTLRNVPLTKSKRKKTGAISFTEQTAISVRPSPPVSPATQSHNISQPLDDTPADGMLKPGDGSKRTKRASAISILSGLGVHAAEVGQDRPNSPESDTASVHSSRPSRASRLRNFFGQRPPSELIQHHLPDFFPGTDKKVIKRAYRKSILRQNRDRQSIFVDGTPWHPNRDSQVLPSRFSVSSMGSLPRRSLSEKQASLINHSTSATTTEDGKSQDERQIPRVSISTEEGESHDLSHDDETASKASTPRSNRFPQLLPPVSLDKEKFSDSFELLPGLEEPGPSSLSPQLDMRLKRDISEATSMLTIDEITAEVESRRNSIAPSASGVSDSSSRAREPPAVPFPIIEDKREDALAQDDSDDDDSSDGIDDEDEEESTVEDGGTFGRGDDEDTLVDEGPSRAVTSKGDVRSIKWIKGALIGKGSFGSVFLAMDAQRGLLMAVKQVELPTGSSQNEERRKAMLTALEREIELLKELQHENIVQYLDSSMDDAYLNIFLEYVPGGSVAALLRNYGAFEEPLVRTFVRQILQGLAYLHERDIIHRDIKGANILVDNKSCVKISDFGISKRVEDSMLGGNNKAHRPSFQGSAFWMAPEVVKQTSYTAKADIWSLGCLCVEMLTGEHPWANLTQMQAIFKIGSSAKPAVPSDVTPHADDFMQKTFDLDYQARPSAARLLEHLWVAYDPLLSFAATNAAINAARGSL